MWSNFSAVKSNKMNVANPVSSSTFSSILYLKEGMVDIILILILIFFLFSLYIYIYIYIYILLYYTYLGIGKPASLLQRSHHKCSPLGLTFLRHISHDIKYQPKAVSIFVIFPCQVKIVSWNFKFIQ